MPNRIFQSVVLQMREGTDRAVGVIDADGIVIACDEPAWMGQHWGSALEAVDAAESGTVVCEERTFKALARWGTQLEYAVFVEGTDDTARSLCSIIAVALNGAKQNYEEKHDKGTFVKNIISDNILLGDIYVQAKELHFDCDVTRGVFLIRQKEAPNPAIVDIIQGMFPDKQNDYVLSVGDNDVAVIKQLPESGEEKRLNKLAQKMEEALINDHDMKVVIGIGTEAPSIRELARSFKEAQLAIEVGKVFETEQSIINYENLGIGRLIYQLPITLCEMFLQEVFKKNPIDALDAETLFTINKFFENNLNVSETARKLFVHRNTLVYRLEKIKKLTGLDLREFDDAITFKVALMVKKYLISCGIDSDV